MPSIPGYCAHCDLAFDSRGAGVVLEDCTNVTIGGGKPLRCPECGRPAQIAAGTFNAIGDRLELVDGPPLTVEILQRLRDIAERAQSEEITPAEAVREARELNPVLGRLLESYLALGLTVLTLFITLIGAYQQQISLEMQRESFALQKLDSDASARFYKEALSLLQEQTELLRESTRQPHDEKRIPNYSRAPTAEEAEKEPPTVKGPSKRRADVRKQRRIELKERRRMFPRRHHWGQS